MIDRREFILLLLGATGSAITWPRATGAQVGDRERRIALIMDLPADHPLARARIEALKQGLGDLGWSEGRNVRIHSCWNANVAERSLACAREGVALQPDVILASGTPAVTALQSVTKEVPIVFTSVADPVESGIVASLAQPGGNATGFTVFEYSLSEKWLELLKEVAPYVTRVAVLRDPTSASGIGQLNAIETVAGSLGVDIVPISLRDASAIEQGLAAFAREPNGGVILTGSPLAAAHRDRIIPLAARHRLPAVYVYRHFVTAGGLISYGPDLVDPFSRAAGYVDQILKGAKPSQLPVQAPTKYEMVVNLKTAKALGINIPPTILIRADEVIE